MRIAVFGATGQVGPRVVSEALARGHEVTAVSRSGGRPPPSGVTHRTADAGNPGDELLVDDAGESSISTEDFAVALLDEAERPRHRRARFTVARQGG